MTPLVLLLPAGGLIWAAQRFLGAHPAPKSPSLAAAGIVDRPRDSFGDVGYGAVWSAVVDDAGYQSANNSDNPTYGDAARPLPGPRVATLSKALGMPTAVIQAIAAVESRGTDSAVRFEPHIYLKARPDLEQGKRAADGTIGVIPYTPTGPKKAWDNNPDHTGKKAFELAFALDRKAAIDATSFGRFQVMGTFLAKLYNGDVTAAWEAWRKDPAAVSDALLVAWFKANKPALEAAKKLDWATLARIYNGGGRVAIYSKLLADAHVGAQRAEAVA